MALSKVPLGARYALLGAICCALPSTFLSRVAAGEPSPQTLLGLAPRQAILVCYSPNLAQLADAWEVLAPLRRSDNPVFAPFSDGLEQLDRRFLQVWGGRLGVTMTDLAQALPGEVLLGWMPRASADGRAFQPDEWVLVARRSPGRDDGIRELWRRIALKIGPSGRSENKQIAGVAVEQVAWEVVVPSELTAPRRPNRNRDLPRDFAQPRGAKSATFSEIRRVERHAFSLGWGETLVFFAASPAERLSPWIAAALQRGETAGLGASLRQSLREANAAGQLVLALQAIPPAWVAPAQSDAERRFGARPENVLLSQIRSLQLVASRRDNQLVFDLQATVLPLPGWIAQILATFGEGTAFSAGDNSLAELSLQADLGRLWTTLHAILVEGWPIVSVAVDMFLAPLGGEQAQGVAQLAATLGFQLALFVFHPTTTGEIGRSWAIAVEVRDRERFAQVEPPLERLLQTFAVAPAHYDVAADGRLRARAQATATTQPLMLAGLHIAQSQSHFVVAGSPVALQQAVGSLLQRPRPAGLAALDRRLADLMPQSSAVRPAVVFHDEVMADSANGMALGGRLRRTIRTPDGVIELDSPLPDAAAPPRSPSPSEKPLALAASRPIARLLGAICVESENTLRLRVGLESLASRASAPSQAPPQMKREPTIQE